MGFRSSQYSVPLASFFIPIEEYGGSPVPLFTPWDKNSAGSGTMTPAYGVWCSATVCLCGYHRTVGVFTVTRGWERPPRWYMMLFDS